MASLSPKSTRVSEQERHEGSDGYSSNDEEDPWSFEGNTGGHMRTPSFNGNSGDGEKDVREEHQSGGTPERDPAFKSEMELELGMMRDGIRELQQMLHDQKSAFQAETTRLKEEASELRASYDAEKRSSEEQRNKQEAAARQHVLHESILQEELRIAKTERESRDRPGETKPMMRDCIEQPAQKAGEANKPRWWDTEPEADEPREGHFACGIPDYPRGHHARGMPDYADPKKPEGAKAPGGDTRSDSEKGLEFMN